MIIRTTPAAPTIVPAAPPPATAPAPASAEPVDRIERSRAAAPSAPVGAPSWTWGRKGHEIVPLEAARALPDTMPPLLRDNAERLAVLGPHPDRWRFTELRHLHGSDVPDHYMNLEALQGKEIPSDRYAYARLMEDTGKTREGQGPQFNGTLPYRMAELFDTLTAEWALYRLETDRVPNGAPPTPLLRQIEENILFVSGMLSHYVADATQPLHSTVHHDGWNEAAEPNPGGFRTRPGLHKEFEVFLVNQAVDPEEVRRRVPPAALVGGDPLTYGVDLVREANGKVKRLYSLEAQGRLNPWKPHPDGVELATERLARGTQAVRDLWYSAWVRSEAVARSQKPTEPPSHDGYLLAR